MPFIIRLSLHAVCADGDVTQVWLSFSLSSSTSPKNIILSARQSVKERMKAHLAVEMLYESQMCLCVRDTSGAFIFLGTAAMAEAELPIVKMPFFEKLFMCEKEGAHCGLPDSSRRGFVFARGALVPLSDLLRINHINYSGGRIPFAMYDVVEITPELSSDPVILESSALRGREKSLAAVNPHASNSVTFNSSSSSDGSTAAGGSLSTPTADKVDRESAGFVCVRYVDFSGRQYKSMVPQAEARSVKSFMRVACDLIGAQAGRVFHPNNMSLMCTMSDRNSHLLESDISLKAALKDVNSRFYLAVDARLLEFPSPNRTGVLCEEPVLLLKEKQSRELEGGALTTDLRDSHWALATSAATLWQLSSLLPAPSFSLSDQSSVLRLRFQNCVLPETKAVISNMRSEEDAARLSLAAAHLSFDGAVQQHRIAERDSTNNAGREALCRKRNILLEELTECISADRDCQRLETLLVWLEKDVADGHLRQEKLIRALYAS